jgi:hypothetical protein
MLRSTGRRLSGAKAKSRRISVNNKQQAQAVRQTGREESWHLKQTSQDSRASQSKTEGIRPKALHKHSRFNKTLHKNQELD